MRIDGVAESADDRLGALDLLIALIRRSSSVGARTIVGIAGSPGSGKTTLADSLVARIGDDAIALPMDGFHLSNVALDRLGLHDRKGAIDTFDADGWAAQLERVRADRGTVWAPGFDRRIDEPVAATIAVEPEHRIVVVEGNYLLMPRRPWTDAARELDLRWFCDTPAEVRERRLVARHTRTGRSADAALAWARDVDGGNAAVIEPTAARADTVISGVDWRIVADRMRPDER